MTGQSRMFPALRAGLAAALIAMPLLAAAPAMGHPGHAAPDATPSEAVLSKLANAESLQLALAADSGNTRTRLALSQIRLEIARLTGSHADYLEAAESFTGLLNAEPDNDDTRLGLAYASMGLHRFATAMSLAREAAESRPSDPETLALLADVHLALGHTTEAMVCTQALLDQELTPESLARLALVHYERWDLESAESAFLEALEGARLVDRPATTVAWCQTMLGEIAALRGKAEEAVRYYRAALAADPDAHAASWALAKLLADAGRIEEAEHVLLDLTAMYPRVQYRLSLADVMLQHGEPHDLKDAARIFAEVEHAMSEKIEHGDPAHAREFAEYLLLRGDDPERAAKLAMDELEHVRQDRGAYETAAWALYANESFEDAARIATRCIRKAPGSPASNAVLGLCLIGTYDSALGLEHLRRAERQRAALPAPLANDVQRAIRSRSKANQITSSDGTPGAN